ncbi:MAG: hypothetical protein ABIK68_08075, partial [bacterium]
SVGTTVQESITSIHNNRSIGVYRHDANRHDPTRAFLLLDTTAIGDTDTISAATLDIYVYTDFHQENTAYDYINVVQSSFLGTCYRVSG